jgi:hypothetical protein
LTYVIDMSPISPEVSLILTGVVLLGLLGWWLVTHPKIEVIGDDDKTKKDRVRP